MPALPDQRGISRRLTNLGDERLATFVRAGDVAAFDALYLRHHPALLTFCRRLLGSSEDGEDALQQTFLRAHRGLREGRPPEVVRPWLFTIARNRCRTLIAARRFACVPAHEHELGVDGVEVEFSCRAELAELIVDLQRLPGSQREALVLCELGDLNHAEIADVIGCPPGMVKALVFQARTTLVAERHARNASCTEIRAARGGAGRRLEARTAVPASALV